LLKRFSTDIDRFVCASVGEALTPECLQKTMTEPLLAELDPTDRVLKRAQYEAFEFSLFDGDVLVRNESYADPENHEYRVRFVDGVPASCECPDDDAYPGPCKHRVAVAIRRPIVDAVQQRQIAADGGVINEQPPNTSDETKSETCDCGELPDDFPCWECVESGRRDIPDLD
jgi:hypothetical protein